MCGLCLWCLVLTVLYNRVAAGPLSPRPAMFVLPPHAISKDHLLRSSDDSNCSAALDQYFAGLESGFIWALQMADASSKLPSGLLAGNKVDLGAYDECLDVAVAEGDVRFTGQHCLVAMQLHLYSPPAFLPPGVLEALGESIEATFSVCLPSLCQHTVLKRALDLVAVDINEELDGTKASISFTVASADCHVRGRPPMDLAEILGLAVTLGLLAMAAICTTVDLVLHRNRNIRSSEIPKCVQALTAFSLKRNGYRLLSESTSAESVSVLHGLKFLSIAWVVVGHRVKFSVQTPLTNLLSLTDYIKEWPSMIILNATLAVDVFFVIGGILNTLNFMRVRPSVTGLLISYVHRYLRLTPAYALMILVTGSWLYRVGDGPLWDRLVGPAKSDCAANWLPGLLYVNNYYNQDHFCMMQSWYLAVDMQLFLLSPVVLYPLSRSPRVGLLILTLLFVFSLVVPFWVAFDYQIKTPIPISMDSKRVSREMSVLYFPTHTKTISYVIGIVTGYVLLDEQSVREYFKLKKWCLVTCWVLAVVSMAWAVLAGHSLFQFDTPYNRWHSSLYIATSRLFWSAGVAWIVTACTTGHGGIVSRFLSWRGFVPLARLTYSIYLTHVAVILYSIASARQPQHFSYYEMILKFLGELVLSTFLAAVLSLTIEAPITALEKIVIPKRHKL